MASIVDFQPSRGPSTSETLRLIEMFLRIGDPVTRQRILAIVEALADEGSRCDARPLGVATGDTILAICRQVLER